MNEHIATERTETASTTELIGSAFDEAKTLIKIEVELAKREARSEITHLKTAGIAFAVAAVTAIVGLATLLVSLVLATGAQWEVALAIGAGLVVAGGIAAFTGVGLVPRKPLERTRQRVGTELQELKERVA